MEPGDGNGWHEWSRHVLRELERMDESIRILHQEMVSLKIEIAMLQVKSGIWGALAGLLPVILYLIFSGK